MTIEARIKLAEARGWKWNHASNDEKMGRWSFKGMTHDWSHVEEHLPDPFTDANDCEALIQWLNDQAWFLQLEQRSTGAKLMIQIYRTFLTSWKHDPWWGPSENWKQGVCELALKFVI